MAYFKVPGGEFLVNDADYEIQRDNLGRPILVPLGGGGGGGGGVTSVNGKRGNVTLTTDDIPQGANTEQFTNADKTELNQATTDITNLKTSVNNKFDKSGGTMTGDINMGSHGITNVEKIAINGQNPMFIGSTIEATSTAPRMTATNDGKVAFVKANTQADYVSISVGTPTNANDAATKKYVDDAIAQAGGLPPATAAEDGKVLTVNAQGVAEWQTLPENIYLVTFSGGNTLTCDRTVAQIKTAINDGKVIVGYFARSYFAFGYSGDDEIAFFKSAETYNAIIRLRDNGTVIKTDNFFVERAQGTGNAGKVLTVGANGNVTPDGKPVPVPTTADVSKVLTARANGAVEWASAGAAQNGIPVGGQTGQVLAKVDTTDYNCEWKSVAVMPGSTVADAGKVLIVNAAGVAEWTNTLDAGNI